VIEALQLDRRAIAAQVYEMVRTNAPRGPRRRPKRPKTEPTLDPASTYAPPHHDLGVSVPVEQQIYDSADADAPSAVEYGAGGFGTGPYGGSGLNSDALNAELPNQPGVIEPKHAPETARETPFAVPIDYGEQPASPGPTVVNAPLIVQDRLEVSATSSKAAADVFSTARSPAPSEDNKALTGFLTELDSSGGRVLSADMLAKHGIIIEGTVDAAQAVRQVSALIAAFDEVAEVSPSRHHNQPPPSLWVDAPEYVSDVKALLVELRRLNDLLEKSLKEGKPVKIEKAAGIFATAGKKFVESYCDAMGKGAAVLTIAAMAGACVSMGVDKGTVESIWNLMKPGK
jgi:hypothetical protein